jgi:NADH-quinone oxidoreductase subunit L
MSPDFSSLVHWILFLPLGAAGFIALFLRRSGAVAAWLSTGVAFAIAALALRLLTATPADTRWHVELAKLGDLSLGFGYLVDANARLMLFVVSFVAAWIHLFSVGYMQDDDARGRFFGGLSIFMFSILGIVVADNLVMTFVFWELVGFSSYMLIAHYFDKDYAAAASKKAFIVNRVGDLGFILGIAMCLALHGTVDFGALKEHAAAAKTIPVAVGALLMCGFLGKSAQFPLHVWLTDAMAGPTPVSALIHAATMVAAGVYFMARVSFLLAPEVLQFIAISGAGMAALAGLCALAQTDIKKSLAYSTLAHLGIMGCAIGLGRPELAVLHMAMHAFFKATLFLGAGSVIHGCHHEQDMLKMGGLARKMPVTTAAFVAATLSNCAVPFLAGWYSKDAILEAAHEHNLYLFALLALAAVATCLYSARLVRLVFFGPANSEAAEHAHESPWTMTAPLVVLGLGFSVAAGFGATALIPAAALARVAEPLHAMAFHATSPATLVGLLALVLGGFAFRYYGRAAGVDSLRADLPRVYGLLEFRWMDTFYGWLVGSVQRRVAEFIAFLDLLLINGVAVRWLGAGLPAVVGYLSGRALHRGQTRLYALSLVAGTLLLAWYFLAR